MVRRIGASGGDHGGVTPSGLPPVIPPARVVTPDEHGAERSGAGRPGRPSRRPRGGALRVPGAGRWGAAVRRLRERRRRVAEAAPHWASGAFAGVQGAVLSLLVVVVPAMAVYVQTSGDPSNADIGWPRSVAVGGALWLLGQGGQLRAGGALVSFVPLGLSLLVVFGCYASARRSAHPVVASWAAALAGHLAVVAVVLLAVGSTGPLGVGPGAVARTFLGAAGLAAVGLGLGVGRRGVIRGWLARHTTWAPTWLVAGVRAGLAGPAALVAVGSAVVLLWVLAGQAPSGDVVAALHTDTFGGAAIALAQTTLVPNLVVWAVSWLTGTGFAVGAGTHLAPSEVLGGPLPAIPVLGALPRDAGGPFVWAPVLVVAVGLLLAVLLHRTMRERAAWEPLAAVAVAVAVAGLVLGVLAAASGGSAGPGRMAVVGPTPVLVGLDGAGWLLLGAVLAVPGSPLVREALGAAVRGGWRRARAGGSAEGAGTGTGADGAAGAAARAAED